MDYKTDTLKLCTLKFPSVNLPHSELKKSESPFIYELCIKIILIYVEDVFSYPFNFQLVILWDWQLTVEGWDLNIPGFAVLTFIIWKSQVALGNTNYIPQ